MGDAAPALALAHHPVRTQIAVRLLPFLFLLYIASFVDRANLAYASLRMSHDLGFDERVFGMGAGIFFIGYLIFQIPGALVAEKWSARLLIGGIMILWGGLTVLTGFVQTPIQLYIARFLLGAAESAFFPAVIVYLTHWFIHEDRTKAIANFMAAIPVSFIVGSPVAGVLLGVHWLSIEGWRWLFLLEGIPASVLGLSTVFCLPDGPDTAAWLKNPDRVWLKETLEEERRIKVSCQQLGTRDLLRYRPARLLAGVAFFGVLTNYSFFFWFPTILKKLAGISDLKVGLLGAIPYVAGLVGMQLNGWHADSRCEQRWHISGPLLVAAVAFLGLLLLPHSLGYTVTLFTVVGAGVLSYVPCMWNFPTLLLSGTASAAVVGFMNMFASLSGFVGPYAIGYLYSRTHSFAGGITMLMCSALVAAFLVLRCPVSRLKAGLKSE
jgi:MFS transporter, ACS family, tartrate transporter